MDDLKKILLAGLGSIAYTYDKSSKFVDELVQRGKLTMEEGKDLSQELKKNFKDSSDKISEKVLPVSREEIYEILEDMKFASQLQVQELKNEISELKEKIKCLEEKQ
ncbi:phasin family protein [Clostridium frigidicarnis]|uniref:Polyhydroxyalkanoate synthesis regulator phasin n=1 Tax=Clostridium frigidicarnis TaxID=84698 RepID=A0A1I1AEW6_9CLOT|nr:phasin family protein [Clostridium frigidicarnis]SFB36555.1 Polyhydroxyalkanoate synthesis regulator phasin [Clostridium frigidicarnis]